MRLRKQADQPRRPQKDCTRPPLSPRTKKNKCPFCGNDKRSIAKTCLDCCRKRKRPPDINRTVYINGEPCRKIPLTQGQYAIVNAKDYEDLRRYPWQAHRQNGDMLYAVAYIAPMKLHIRMHRFIMGVLSPDIEVDHRNGNGLDNRRGNLRVCSPLQNSHNRTRLNKNNKSGCVGVHYNSGRRRWISTMTCEGKVVEYGYHKTLKDAIQARYAAEIKYFGDFAPNHSNFNV